MKASIKASRGSTGGFTVQFSQSCSACHGCAKSARREFSDQAWAALLSWGEIHTDAIDQPICNDCYFNLRDVLIDRAEEIAVAASANHFHALKPRVGSRVAAG